MTMLFYCFFIFGFAINDAKYPKNIAAAIPPAFDFTPPINAPNSPTSFTDSNAPFARLAPNPVSGTVAPAPAKFINYLYIPRPPNIAPTVTNITSILAGVNFVLSNKIWPIIHIPPPVTKHLNNCIQSIL